MSLVRIEWKRLATAKTGVASKAFVPQPLEKGIRLYPPLLVVPGTEAAYLEGRVKGSAETQAEAALSWTGLYPFDARAFVPLLGPPLLGTAEIRAVVPCAVGGPEAFRIAFRAAFINAATGERTTPRVVPEGQVTAHGAVIQTLRVSPGGAVSRGLHPLRLCGGNPLGLAELRHGEPLRPLSGAIT